MLVIRDDSNYKLYQYTPQLVPAIIAAGLFALGGIAHIILLRKLQAKYFVPFVVGCFMEALGYGGRIWSHFDPTGLPGFIIQALLILIAPALFAATIYMVLGRIIDLVDGERHSVIRLKWLTKIFVAGDSVSFLVQAMGGGIQAGGTLGLLHTGEKIIVVGLFIQIFFFGIFLISAILFHYRINRAPTPLSSSPEIPWRQHMNNLYLTSVIILVRSVFRVIEYLMGNSGWILSHEYMLYIFDTILMLSVVGIFLWRHPGKLFLNHGKGSHRSSGTEFDLLESQERK